MAGGMLPAVLSPMRGYGLPQFDPIYAAAEKLDVPIAVRGGPPWSWAWTTCRPLPVSTR